MGKKHQDLPIVPLRSAQQVALAAPSIQADVGDLHLQYTWDRAEGVFHFGGWDYIFE